MKITEGFLAVTLILLSGATFAADSTSVHIANECLAYGKQEMKENPDMLNTLNEASVVAETIQVNKYDRKVGSQMVSTELVAEINSGEDNLGTILCLFESDSKPLYFFFDSLE
jgi:hypothetical protein